MNIYEIDGNSMLTREDAHGHIASRLGFPDYYGGNLDALWDVLGGFRGCIKLHASGAMLAALGHYGVKLLATFYEAEEENERLSFEIED